MIMKFSSSSFKYAGRVNDEIWTSSGLRGIARRRIRPTTRETKFDYRALFSLEPAKAAWRTLGSATQTEWSNLADSTFGWPLQGSPRYMDGETFFANFYTVLLTLDEFAPLPDVPSGGPAWQTKPKFWEFATWESNVYTLKAETEFEEDTILLFSGLPPSLTGFKPEFQREQFIGNEELSSGLSVNEEFDSVHDMMENTFGTITSAQKIWGRIWEVQDGYIRTLKDPCTPDPGDAPPAVDSIQVITFNDWNDVALNVLIEIWNSDYEEIGIHEFYDMPAFATDTTTIQLYEGMTTADIWLFIFTADWDDGEILYEEIEWDETTPYNYSLYPNEG